MVMKTVRIKHRKEMKNEYGQYGQKEYGPLDKNEYGKASRLYRDVTINLVLCHFWCSRVQVFRTSLAHELQIFSNQNKGDLVT